MKEYFEKIVVPHRERMIIKHDLDADAKCIVLFDCWSVHKSEALLSWLFLTYSWLIIIFVPAGCTGLFQPLDVGINRVFKHGIRMAANSYFTELVTKQIRAGIPPESVQLSTSIGPLRDATVGWIESAFTMLEERPELR
ncbi:hypothetical protein BJ508DRAFT_200255, partial [Ascobolus immersus RN42]